jgi:hypothetical protein
MDSASYPDRANVQIIVRAIQPPPSELTVRAEEIGLAGPPIGEVLHLLGALASSSIYVSAEFDSDSLEAVVTEMLDSVQLPPPEMSHLARRIISAFTPYLAEEPETLFSPVHDLFALKLDQAVIERSQIDTLHTSLNDASGGEATVKTPIGKVLVVRDASYLLTCFVELTTNP